MKEHFETRPRLAWAVAGALVGAIVGLLFIGNFGVGQGGSYD